MKKIFVLLLLLAVVVAAGMYYWLSQSSQRPTFRTATAVRDNLLVAASATGSVEPMEVIDVGRRRRGSSGARSISE